MIDVADYDGMLADLYAGITDPSRMTGFLRRLSRASGSHTTALIRHNLRGGVMPFVTEHALAGELLSRYEDQFGAPDDKLWFQRSATAMHTGAVFVGEQWATKREIKRTRYYEQFLREIDTVHSAALCGLFTPEHAAFLTPCRDERAGPYEGDALRVLQQLAPHWVNACALNVRLEQAETGASAGPQRALFLLDRQLRWIGGNAAAERVVALGWWQGRQGGPLDAPSPATQAAWQRAQRQVGEAGAAARVPIPVHDARQALVAFAHLQPYGAFAHGEGLPHYLLFVRPLAMFDSDELAAHLRTLFGLTPAEAALALALHRDGNLQDAAGALGIGTGTAKTRLQVVFEKTSTHRRSDLLRLLQGLADVLA